MSDDGQKFDDPVYEMLWDCPACDTPKLLGKTHRHCPACGCPQDPSARYFPEDDADKVAVQDHVYFGADRACPACDAPQSAKAKFCGSCGSPLDEAAVVDRVTEKAPPPPPTKGGLGAGVIALVVGVLALGCGGVLCLGLIATFWTSEAKLAVTGHTWERTIAVEEYKASSESDWCDNKPGTAYDVRRSTKKRDTRKIPDGETCTTRKVDNGDGTFREVQDCKTKYRTEDVMDDWCAYKVDKWQVVRTAEAKGKGLTPAPSWPGTDLGGACSGATLGCKREGQRGETYTVHLSDEAGAHTCEVDAGQWEKMAKGSGWVADKSVVTGSLQCDSLRKP